MLTRLLGIMEERRIPEEADVHIHTADLDDLQKLDPLRRAFALAEEAEYITTKGNYTSTNLHPWLLYFAFAGKGMTELNYANIQTDLGTYMHTVLTQCADMEEVEVIENKILQKF